MLLVYFDGFDFGILLLSLQGEQRPHLHLELVGSKIQQHLIFVNSPEEISVPAVDCLIYNDGRRSAGCLRREFQDYVSDSVAASSACVMITFQYFVLLSFGVGFKHCSK